MAARFADMDCMGNHIDQLAEHFAQALDYSPLTLVERVYFDWSGSQDSSALAHRLVKLRSEHERMEDSEMLWYGMITFRKAAMRHAKAWRGQVGRHYVV